MKVLSMLATLMLPAIVFAQGWQEKIDKATTKSFITQEDHISAVIGEMTDADPYWKAYADYNLAIVHISQDNEKESKVHAESAIDLLEAIEDQGAEEKILLAALTSFSITFSPMSAPTKAAKANKLFEEALKEDPDNMRAYLGIGRGDYYRPKMFGGGKVVEENLQKALSLPVKTSDDPDAPSWGRDDVFMYLAMFYEREKRKPEGILTCKRGLKEFPDHGAIQGILKKLQAS